ncbi:leucine-rich repeat-containing protein 69 [Huso huso]|uniref:Leucine-rich repeat-containing protein 69 n=1 Tax=Huso huso TaxID=61971 RepID=A0ABR1A303_HUSHU
MSDILVLRAIQGNAKTLNLNSKKLKRVPKAVGKLTSLSILQLQNNSIATLPCEVESLNNLTELNIGNNVLEEVPVVLKHLKSLRKLHLFGNRIEKIPCSVFDGLRNLVLLNLNNNNIWEIPPDIQWLINLEQLSLNNNELKNLPLELCFLEKLSELQLSNNNLTTLPPEFCLLANLTKLRVSRNCLNELPEGIHKLRKLRVIDVAGNQLKMFPATFNELLLDELYCEDNPFLQKKLVPSIQDEEILSLKEITARYILKELRVRLSEVRVAITRYPEVRIMLSEASMCALCGKGFLNIWLECVKFVNIRKEMKITSKINTIPVRALLCSYKCFNQQGHDYYGVAVP